MAKKLYENITSETWKYLVITVIPQFYFFMRTT